MQRANHNWPGVTAILFRVIYNDDLYFPYRNAQGTCQLAKFDGSSISLIPNSLIPTTNSITNLIVYKNKIYFIYTINAGSSQLGEYHGERMFLFPNPINSDSTQGGLDRFPVIYNNALFWSYQSKPNYHQLAKFDGNKLILIDNPDSSEQGYLGNPIIYQNDLYLQYLDQNDYLRLARLEDVSGVSVNEKISSFIIYPNPATDQITIDTSLPSDKYHILLFTATGKLILSQSFTGSGIQIDINGLSGGIYIVKLISKEVIGQKKIIKM